MTTERQGQEVGERWRTAPRTRKRHRQRQGGRRQARPETDRLHHDRAPPAFPAGGAFLDRTAGATTGLNRPIPETADASLTEDPAVLEATHEVIPRGMPPVTVMPSPSGRPRDRSSSSIALCPANSGARSVPSDRACATAASSRSETPGSTASPITSMRPMFSFLIGWIWRADGTARQDAPALSGCCAERGPAAGVAVRSAG